MAPVLLVSHVLTLETQDLLRRACTTHFFCGNRVGNWHRVVRWCLCGEDHGVAVSLVDSRSHVMPDVVEVAPDAPSSE